MTPEIQPVAGPTILPAVLSETDIATLESIQQRVLWLAVRMVDWANHDRPNSDGIKVGGHQASSASMVGIMTALWFGHLDGEDRVAVKPHASPVFHVIQYLLGNLDRSYLTRLREYGGLQSYPSRTKDPDGVDFSTGSVGLGAAAPLFAAAVRRWVDHHFDPRPTSRFVALLGDAELDEGNIWEAITDPATRGLGNVLWVVDLNRQSLDRVVPGIKAHRLISLFRECGWNVIEAKYGRKLQAAFDRPGGEALRHHLDTMSNQEYQSLFAHRGAELRARFLRGADRSVKRALSEIPDDDLAALVQNLGGHDIAELVAAYHAADQAADQPSVVFAYTVKGWGLPIAGDPLNHSASLSRPQIDALRSESGLASDNEWDGFGPGTPEGRHCEAIAHRLRRSASPPPPPVPVPTHVGVATAKPVSTQETFGRILSRLADHPEVARRLVTTSPDVSVSTNLGGWINKTGVFSPEAEPDWLGEGRLLRWKENPQGHHLELGISEMNLFLLLGQLGLGHELHGETLLPIGTLYDPFVCRGLDALIYACYTDARFIVVGTPSGISLAPEGGAHQSTITASIGLELPGITFAEPAYAQPLDWLLCDGLARLTAPDGEALYLRLSTRPIDQTPFDTLRKSTGDETLRADVLNGGYRLVTPPADDNAPRLIIAVCGAVVPEAVLAAKELTEEGIRVTVLDLCSPDRLYRDWRRVTLRAVRNVEPVTPDHQLARIIRPEERQAPIVAVHDAASHSLAWLGSVFGNPLVTLGVDTFGQSGTIGDLYRAHDLTADSIVRAGLVALGEQANRIR